MDNDQNVPNVPNNNEVTDTMESPILSKGDTLNAVAGGFDLLSHFPGPAGAIFSAGSSIFSFIGLFIDNNNNYNAILEDIKNIVGNAIRIYHLNIQVAYLNSFIDNFKGHMLTLNDKKLDQNDGIRYVEETFINFLKIYSNDGAKPLSEGFHQVRQLWNETGWDKNAHILESSIYIMASYSVNQNLLYQTLINMHTELYLYYKENNNNDKADNHKYYANTYLTEFNNIIKNLDTSISEHINRINSYESQRTGYDKINTGNVWDLTLTDYKDYWGKYVKLDWVKSFIVTKINLNDYMTGYVSHVVDTATPRKDWGKYMLPAWTKYVNDYRQQYLNPILDIRSEAQKSLTEFENYKTKTENKLK